MIIKLVMLKPGIKATNHDFRALTVPGGEPIKAITFFRREEVVHFLNTRDWQNNEPWVLEGSFLFGPNEVRGWINEAISSSDEDL